LTYSLKVIYRSGLNITFIDKVNQAFVNYYNYAEEIKKVFRDRKCMRKYKIDEQDFIERKELEALILEELKVKQEIFKILENYSLNLNSDINH